MKNKIELKKTIFKSILIAFVVIVISCIYQFYQYKVYTMNFNNKIGSIITKIKEVYPDIDQNELIEIINSKSDINTDLLKMYGIEMNEDSIIIQNDKYFTIFTISNLLIMAILAVVILAIFLKYNYEKNKNLNEILKYLEEINNKNYKLEIEENTEDELSILKNEIYKTSIMLKEVAENSIKIYHIN